MIIIETKQIINTINQKNYSFIISSLDFSILPCPKCNHTGLSVHAYYSRNLKNNPIRITRVRCPHCGSTHALLLEPMIPFLSSVSSNDIITIISHAFDDLELENSHISYLLRRFASCICHYSVFCILNSRNYPLSFITT